MPQDSEFYNSFIQRKVKNNNNKKKLEGEVVLNLLTW